LVILVCAGFRKLKNHPIKKLEIVVGDEMKKRQRASRKSPPPKAAKAAAPEPAVKAGSGSSLAGWDFKPVEIRGEPLFATVLRERR
jgi:hypothetical protein